MAEGFKIGEGYVEITAKVDKSQTEEAAQLAGDAAGTAFEERVTKRVGERFRDHRGRFAKDAEEALSPGGNQTGRSFGRRMIDGIGTAFKAVGSGVFTNKFTKPIGEALTSFATSPYGLAAIASMVASAGTLIASGLSATISAGLVGGLGTAGIGLGAWLLRGDKDLQAGVHSLISTLSKNLRSAAGVLKVPLLGALDDFKRAIPTIMPIFQTLFKSLAPAIQPLADGIIRMIQQMAPGLQSLASRTGPFLIDLAKRLPGMGASIGKFFQKIADNWPKIEKSFFQFSHDVGTVIHALSVAFVWLSANYGKVKTVFMASISPIMQAYGAIKLIITAISWLIRTGAKVIGWGANVHRAMMAASRAVSSAGSAIMRWFGRVGDTINRWGSRVHSVMIAASRAVSSAGAVIGRWFSRLGSAVSTAGSKIHAAMMSASHAVSSAMSAAGSAIARFVSRAVSLLGSVAGKARTALGRVKGAVVGALSGAGSWLVGAGRAIVMGLVDGIRGAIGAAASAAASMAQAAVDAAKSHLHINSPSKLVAKEVGAPIAEGVAYGVERAAPVQARRVGAAVVGMIPAPRAVLGGGSSSVTTDNSIGTVQLHVHAAPGMNVDSLSRAAVKALHERLENHKRGYR